MPILALIVSLGPVEPRRRSNELRMVGNFCNSGTIMFITPSSKFNKAKENNLNKDFY
jgi:hypothetical protein